MIKRFIIFAGNDYYAQGGWSDFVSSHDDELSAMEAAEAWRNANNVPYHFAWLQIVDTQALPDVKVTIWSGPPWHEI